MSWFMVRRLGVLLGVLGFAYALTLVVTPISDLIGIEDGLQFFLASIVFVRAWPSTVRFFTEHPLKVSRLLSLGVSFWAISFMLASVWAVIWRASAYSMHFSDDLLRYGFRFSAICGAVCAIAAPELFEQEISTKRLGKLGLGLACIVLTVVMLVYSSRLKRVFLHDAAPTPATLEDSP